MQADTALGTWADFQRSRLTRRSASCITCSRGVGGNSTSGFSTDCGAAAAAAPSAADISSFASGSCKRLRQRARQQASAAEPSAVTAAVTSALGGRGQPIGRATCRWAGEGVEAAGVATVELPTNNARVGRTYWPVTVRISIQGGNAVLIKQC
jgi:hypothetical protein